jgi:hypothetical protein
VALLSTLAAIVVAAAGLFASDRDQSPERSSPSRAVGPASENSTSSLPGPGQYRYIKERSAYLSTWADVSEPFSVLIPQTNETWVAPDGSGFRRTKLEQPVWLGDRDRNRWEEMGSPELVGDRSQEDKFDAPRPGEGYVSFGADGLTLEQLQDLPSDPHGLYESIYEAAEETDKPTNYAVFVAVSDLLRTPILPEGLEPALYDVATRIPGVEVIDEVSDPLGRVGTAVTMVETLATPSPDAAPGLRQELIFDPTTGALLAERDVTTGRVEWLDADPGTVVGYRAIVETAIVDADGNRPPWAAPHRR